MPSDPDVILTPVGASVLTDESTASTTYTDLATVGPSVTVTITATGLLLVGWSVQADNPSSFVSVALSGANTEDATDNYCLGAVALIAGTTHLFTGLTAGDTVVTCKYRAGIGTVGFERRHLWAIAF